MLILITQSAYTLFAARNFSQETNTVDVIVRTSAAAIFGYFLSGNFVKPSSSVPEKMEQDPPEIRDSAQAQGQVPSTGSEEKRTETTFSPVYYTKMQVIIVAAIGIFSLIPLLIVRNFAEITPETAATVSQFRGFVSASVGFLVGCKKHE